MLRVGNCHYHIYLGHCSTLFFLILICARDIYKITKIENLLGQIKIVLSLFT
jgi:hypothetical protein